MARCLTVSSGRIDAGIAYSFLSVVWALVLKAREKVKVHFRAVLEWLLGRRRLYEVFSSRDTGFICLFV